LSCLSMATHLCVIALSYPTFFAPELASKISSAHGPPQFDIVHAGAVYHLMTKEQGERLSAIAYSFVAPGGLFLGGMVGSDAPVEANRVSPTDDLNGLRYLHSPASFTTMLQHAGFTNVQAAWYRNRMPQGSKWGLFGFSARKPAAV